MLHRMYHDLLSVGRFLKYDNIDDTFVEATKDEVIRKISQAIQYQKRTRMPEDAKRKYLKSHHFRQMHGIGNKSFSSGICVSTINQRSGHHSGLFPGDESKHRTGNLDLFKNIIRDQEDRNGVQKLGDSDNIPRTKHGTSARAAILPSMACVNVNWSFKPLAHSTQEQRSSTVPSKQTPSLDFDTLVSDAIDAVLGKRQTETLPSYETIGDAIQNGGHR
jgi:hypothetical protein